MRRRGAKQGRALPCPGVHLPPGFVRRLERMTLRLAAARERREGAGGAALAGGGEEFVGYRPYRPGEDLRRLDWNLFARLDQPFVRVTRREASERWAILLDTSASMGVGPPGKLQAAAEAACGFACVGLRAGARVVLYSTGRPRQMLARRMTDLPELLQFLTSSEAAGPRGLGSFLDVRRPPADCGRVFLIGDLLDLDPRRAVALHTRGREVFCVQILAPLELAPPPGARVRWWDPEGPGHAERELDGATLAAYERALEERLAVWDSLAARHGFSHGLFSSERAFEDVVRATLER
ncbi:MAG: DUF58 domain-containing protein [Planctomycetota bacterium]